MRIRVVSPVRRCWCCWLLLVSSLGRYLSRLLAFGHFQMAWRSLYRSSKTTKKLVFDFIYPSIYLSLLSLSLSGLKLIAELSSLFITAVLLAFFTNKNIFRFVWLFSWLAMTTKLILSHFVIVCYLLCTFFLQSFEGYIYAFFVSEKRINLKTLQR